MPLSLALLVPVTVLVAIADGDTDSEKEVLEDEAAEDDAVPLAVVDSDPLAASVGVIELVVPVEPAVLRVVLRVVDASIDDVIDGVPLLARDTDTLAVPVAV